MICSRAVIFCYMVHVCYGWKIRPTNVSNLEELKTKCSLACPFQLPLGETVVNNQEVPTIFANQLKYLLIIDCAQKQIANLYMDDITCEIDCKIEHCVKGCRLMETALETECESLCNIRASSSPANSSDIFCFIGCKESLLVYFESIKQEISNLEAPILVEHTLTTTSLTLEWNEPKLVNETFMLQCRFVDNSNEWQFCQNQMWISSNVVNVQTLQPYTKYQFRVALRLTPGDWYDIFSEPSSIIATLPGGLPISPPNIQTATPVSHDIISIIWKEGEFTNGPVLSYILQINELPVGYAGVKDVIATKEVHSCMLKNLQASTRYHITISARNSAGLGPPATVIVKTKPLSAKSTEKVDLMVATEHSVYSISSDVQEEPVLMYNSTHVIKGVALHVHRELLFISDSSGSIIVTSSKGLLTPQELSIPPSSKPSALTIDWLSDHLYILNEILHPSGSIVYQVARCSLDGSNLVVVVSGFIMKPHHIEVDPYNGYLFWVVRGVGLYRLDLIDISKVINRNVSPELILDDPNLGAFLVNCNQFRIIIHAQTEIISISLDGQDAEEFCDQNHEAKFENVDSLTMAGGSLFSTDGEHLYQDVCDSQRAESFVENITNKLSMENCKAVIVNTLYSQPFPVPVNPPTFFQAIFGHDVAKVSWERPYRLAGQGEGAWSGWSYRLTVDDSHGNRLFDFNDLKANQHTVLGLKPGTDYVLRVAAYTFSGEGPWSKEFCGKTLRRNASLLWSSTEGLLLSDITGYHVTKIEPINYLEEDAQFIVTDIDWYADEVFVTTHKRQVFWYNLTTNTHGRIHDINGADCISIEWLSKKLYWGSKTSKMIFRADLNGSKQEILPIIVATESLFIDSLTAYIYWSTKNSVEGARLDGSEKKVFYASKNAFQSQILGLAVDIHGSELYWIEKTSAYPRLTALMILNVTNNSQNFSIDKFTLINQDAGGGLCYIDQHLVWIRNDDKNAMISGLNGTTTALIQSESLSNLITCTAVDPSLREISSKNNSEDVNVIPKSVTKSSIKIDGSFEAFNISWNATTNVNYGNVYYRLLIKIDNVDINVNTQNTFVALRSEKAYVPLKITLQAYTFWSTSEPVRITLRSPSSTPSAPTDPRVFVTHKRKSLFQQKEVSVLVRWSPPVEPNGIIKRYELSCFVTHNHTNSSGTTCSSSQISVKTLEFTLQNLPTNKIYNFQIRACNDYGCGNWSNVVRADFEDEIPVPKLLVITNEGLTKMDYDRKSFSMAIPDTKNIRDIFYEASRSVVYWIERENVYQSYLNLHLTNIKKLAELKTNGICLSYDWIGRNLFWVQTLDGMSNVNALDLNRNEDEIRPNVLFERPKVVKTILASPMNSILIWVELETEKSQFGTLMRSSFDGTNMMEFFAKEISSFKNDVSSSVLPTVEEHEVKCNSRCNSSKIGPSITLYPSSQNEYGLLWFDVSANYVMTTDLEACNCKRVIQLDAKNGLPKSITADSKRVYWLDSDDVTVYSVFLNEVESEIDKVTASGGVRLKRISSYGSKLQFFPDARCLWPHLKPEAAQVVKFSSDSIILRLPKVKREKLCSNVSLATVEYTIYHGLAEDNDTSSNCSMSNLKVCWQVVTFDRVKKITKLKPFTRYVFIVGIGNYYSQLEGVDPIVGDAAIYRTAPGAPSPARNVTAVPCTPYSVLIEWQPPKYFNAEAVGYSVLWWKKNTPAEVTEGQVSRKKSNTSMVIDALQPAQEYVIQIKTFAMAHRLPIPGIAYQYSESVHVRTYSLPGNVTLTNVTSSSLNLSFPLELRALTVKVELYNRESNKWELVTGNNSRYALLEKLNPLTRYNVRLKVQYPLSHTPFTWTEDGFEFETLGDIPNAPQRPILNRIDDNTFETRWKPPINNGRHSLIYELQGSFCNLEDANRKLKTKDKFRQWNIFYNGTNNSWITNSLKRDSVYIFRVRAKNEFGFGNFSENSEEYELLNNKYEMIFLWSAIPLFGVGVVTVLTTIYVYYCRKSKSKHEFAKNQIIKHSRADIIELINLPEIPSAKVINTNLLYTPRVGDQHQTNEEFSRIPRVQREQIGLTKFLGSGAFGEVYEGKVKNLLYANIDTKVAIKALRKNATEQEKSEFLKEALLMSNFKHKHILQLLGICVDNDPHFIIMELMEGGDLLSYLRSNRSTATTPESGLSYADLLGICCDVASGCCYLEEMHFVHRDLACRNCLVSSKDAENRIVKIGDFGLARDVYKNDYYRKKGEGLLPVRWMAPESLVDGVFTRHSDVWSFGVLLWEVMSLGQQPYQARSNVEVLQYVRTGGRLTRPSNCPLKLYKLMGKCWNFKPKERPTFAYCLSELEDLRSNCNLERLCDYSNLVDYHRIDLEES